MIRFPPPPAARRRRALSHPSMRKNPFPPSAWRMAHVGYRAVETLCDVRALCRVSVFGRSVDSGV